MEVQGENKFLSMGPVLINEWWPLYSFVEILKFTKKLRTKRKCQKMRKGGQVCATSGSVELEIHLTFVIWGGEAWAWTSA